MTSARVLKEYVLLVKRFTRYGPPIGYRYACSSIFTGSIPVIIVELGRSSYRDRRDYAGRPDGARQELLDEPQHALENVAIPAALVGK